MKKVLFTLLIVVIGLAPVVAAAQTPGGADKSAPSSSDKSPSGADKSTPSGGSGSSAPSASPSTSGETSTDLSQHKTQNDCEAAGGQWQATTKICQKKASK